MAHSAAIVYNWYVSSKEIQLSVHYCHGFLTHFFLFFVMYICILHTMFTLMMFSPLQKLHNPPWTKPEDKKSPEKKEKKYKESVGTQGKKL